MIFDFFKRSKNPPLKLKPRQEVEIEFFSEESGFETHFTQILDVGRKKVIVKSPGTERRPIRMLPGQKLTITTLEDNVLFSFDTTILDAGDREFDIATPSETKEEKLPTFDDNYQIEVPITVEFRAMNSAHNQVAQTYAITTSGLVLTTNLPIPPGTALHLEIEIPGAPDFAAKGKAVGSRQHPVAKSKHLCEIEYIDIEKADALAVMRYAIYSKQRQMRKAQREELEGLR